MHPTVRCGKCYSLTRILNPVLPFLGGVKIYFFTPSNPHKRPAPSSKAKKANPPKRPSPKAKKADPPKPASPSLNAKKADPSNSTDMLCSKKEDDSQWQN
ncbi:hypothetical protein M0R45_035075 [Rubus argutus]|uniref:Uncharacterized protein n=1 Tax=Rubus argutus TaxID=59490 RepID=A0AAW1VWG3_RUBAR